MEALPYAVWPARKWSGPTVHVSKHERAKLLHVWLDVAPGARESSENAVDLSVWYSSDSIQWQELGTTGWRGGPGVGNPGCWYRLSAVIGCDVQVRTENKTTLAYSAHMEFTDSIDEG